ncbi:hypothetical protein TNCV_299891 [Trichonephila clavipes]|nr:hypothetical protein TNCV_299891 [Trichonephila clavipes]
MQHPEGNMQIKLNLQHALAEDAGGLMDRRGRSHPPHCTTSREDRQIVRMAVTDLSVTSRTVAWHIESVTHHQCRRVPFDAVYS